jgi:HEAT repeat protein
MSNWVAMSRRARVVRGERRAPVAAPVIAPVIALLAALTCAPACGPAATGPPVTGPPPLPGVAAGEREWFWRDVLAAPLPGEPAPDAAARAAPTAVARVDALDALLLVRAPSAVGTAMAALRDPEEGVAVVAAHALGELGDRRAIPRLLAGIGPYPVDYDVPLSVRVAEASALARLGNPAGVPLLLDVLAEHTALERPEHELQWTRTERMAFAQELALPGLLALAGTDFGFHPMAPVPAREAAVAAARTWWEERRLSLWAAAPLEAPGLVERARLIIAHLGAYQLRQIDNARFVLTGLGPGVVPHLREALDSPDDYVRVHALEVIERLAAVSDGKGRARLASIAGRPLLEDEVGAVAAQAARASGAVGSSDALVVALDRRTEPELRVAIVDALGRTGLPAARERLLAFEGAAAAPLPPDLDVALQAALLALDCARDPQAFLDRLGSPDVELAFAALERLIVLTGSDCGVEPTRPPAERAAALAAARAALEERCRD